MSANWGSMGGSAKTDRNAKFMIRAWFAVTCAALIFIMLGGRI